MTRSTVHGKKIVVTRATHQASDFINQLHAIGAIPISYPCIAISPPDDTTELDAQLHKLDSFDWLLLTSPNTVRAIHQRLNDLSLQPNWSHIKIAVVGSKTAKAVQTILGQAIDFMPTDYTGDALGHTLPNATDQSVFLPISELADDTLSQTLNTRGAHVTQVIAYQNSIGTGGADVPELLQHHQIDMLTFTSSSTVENFLQRIDPISPPNIPTLCIGPSTAKTATSCGFQHVLMPNIYTIEGMIQRIHDYYTLS